MSTDIPLRRLYGIVNALYGATIGRDRRAIVFRSHDVHGTLGVIRAAAAAADMPMTVRTTLEVEDILGPRHVVVVPGEVDDALADHLMDCAKRADPQVHVIALIPEATHLRSLAALGRAAERCGIVAREEDLMDHQLMPSTLLEG